MTVNGASVRTGTGGKRAGRWAILMSGDQVGPVTVIAVLRALAVMAGMSRRHEADVTSALQGAGLTLDPAQRDAALQQLLDAECIERLIPLTDGGILLSVTATGMARARGSS